MGNPYAATKLPPTPEERLARDKVMILERLRLLGLDDEGLRDLEENFSNFSDDWTPDAARALARMPDAKLREAIRARDDEFDASTLTEDEQTIADREAAVAEAETVAADKIQGTVPEILEWVGEDPVRAMAVSNLELGPEGGSRKTLVEALDRIIGGDAS